MKQKLLDLIVAAREEEAAHLVPFVNDEPAERPGEWTAKDQLAHITAWRQVAAAELVALHDGTPGPVISNDDGAENARIYGRTHDQPPAAVIAESKQAWDELAAAVEISSEADLAKPRARRPEEAYSMAVLNHTLTHFSAHIGDFHRDRGDDKGVELVTRWARDLAVATFPGGSPAGVGEYNLGCYYALRGRAEEAIRHLRRGLELRPDLRDWATKDTDLDPIRDSQELRDLLG